MAKHKEFNFDNPRIEENEAGELVLKGCQLEKLVTWENGGENAEIHKDPDFERKIVLSQDYDGLPLRDVLEAMFRKFTIDARGRFRDQMEPHEAVGFVDSLPNDTVPEYGDTKRAEWKVALGTGQLFERPKTASEIAAEIESGDHSPEELEELIQRLRKIKEQSS